MKTLAAILILCTLGAGVSLGIKAKATIEARLASHLITTQGE